ncbi:MAG: alpha-L-fucosidase [Bacteroidales bacterium]|nr:alpha-L-fucosidase [Bacteroidales bacterium]
MATRKPLSCALLLSFLLIGFCYKASAQDKSLHQLQQEFVDLRFGMFVHFGLPTFQEADWTDPDLDAAVFNPTKLDTRQWVATAKSAGATFICISVKHHAGFCMWDTATTDYSVMHTPLGRDVLKELTDALAEAGMQVMFHFSILDTHHRIRHTLPFTPEKTAFIKAQIKELLTGYGPVNTIMFDGWDAPWGRISYTDVSFPELYSYIKSLQPDCLVMDLNGAKYPQEALFYSDIRCYEQGAGQKISAQVNRLPAMACYPLQRTWFWKESFPTDELKDVEKIVADNIIPYNQAYCTYILNAAPNREGLIDPNAQEAMRRIGRLWKNTGHLVDVPEAPAPITAINLAVDRTCDSSWSEDCDLMDLANDDNFATAWVSSPSVKEPWWKVKLDKNTPVSMVVITERGEPRISKLVVEALQNGEWKSIATDASRESRVHICRFSPTRANAIRVRFISYEGLLSISEVGVYNELPKIPKNN